jgi:hypothetical protein
LFTLEEIEDLREGSGKDDLEKPFPKSLDNILKNLNNKVC